MQLESSSPGCRPITHAVSFPRHALPLFTSLLNVVCAYDPVGYGIPYNHLLFSDYREQLVEQAVQILIVTLEHDGGASHRASSPSRMEEQEVWHTDHQKYNNQMLKTTFAVCQYGLCCYLIQLNRLYLCAVYRPRKLVCELFVKDSQRGGMAIIISVEYMTLFSTTITCTKLSLSPICRTLTLYWRASLGCSPTLWLRLTCRTPPRRSSSTKSFWCFSGSFVTSIRLERTRKKYICWGILLWKSVFIYQCPFFFTEIPLFCPEE